MTKIVNLAQSANNLHEINFQELTENDKHKSLIEKNFLSPTNLVYKSLRINEALQVQICKNYKDTGTKTVQLREVLSYVHFGIVAPYNIDIRNDISTLRTGTDENTVAKIKAGLPCLLTSVILKGTGKSAKNIKGFTGLIQIDIDTDFTNEQKEALKTDAFTLVSFASPRNKIKIIAQCNATDLKTYEKCWYVAENYYKTKYGLQIDIQTKNANRLCFFSFDSNIVRNEQSNIFEHEHFIEVPELPTVNEPIKPTNQRTNEPTANSATDLDKIHNIIAETIRTGNNVDGIYTYTDGQRNKFLMNYANVANRYGIKKNECEALIDMYYVDAFSEAVGAQPTINNAYNNTNEHGKFESAFMKKYNAVPKLTANQKSIIKEVAGKRKATIGKPGGATDTETAKENTLKYCTEIENISPELAKNYINEIWNEAKENTPDVYQRLTDYFKHEGIYRNEITLYLAQKNKALFDTDLNSIFIEAKRKITVMKKGEFETFINSNHVQNRNFVTEFFENNKAETTDNITKLASCLNTKHSKSYVELFIKKWLVGLVASAYDKNFNILFLVLIGTKNTGKTEFFKRLLPNELQTYFTTDKLQQGKDSEALMCEKLLILNDELDGFNKNEAKTFRNFISANQYTYRPPYAKSNVTRKRLASCCGTSNDLNIINDIANNRRIIPIELSKAYDFKLFNSINKKDLFIEAYNLFKTGYDYTLNDVDIFELEHNSKAYAVVNVEEELIIANFKIPEQNELIETSKEYLQTSEIKAYLESITKQKLSINKIGSGLKNLGFLLKSVRKNNNPVKAWEVQKSNEVEN